MDSISNLSTNLPPTSPINDATLNEIQSDLTTEFKNAAKSVASLYKLSLMRNSVLRHQGYLDAINDLVNVIKNGGDVENWALLKKFELEGKLTGDDHTHENGTTTEADSQVPVPITKIPEDYKFTMSAPAPQKFPATMPILSVQATKRDQPHRHTRTQLKTSGITSTQGGFSSENDEFISEDGTLKRKVEEHKIEKRPKF